MDKATIDNLTLEVKKEAIEGGYDLAFITEGSSMFPILASENKITVTKCNFKELKPGDLILFKSPTDNGSLVAHRLIRKIKNENDHTFISKGDAVFNPDKPICQDALIGKIVKIKKRGLSIPLEGAIGRVINGIALVFSMGRITYFGFLFLRKIRYLIKIYSQKIRNTTLDTEAI